MAFKYSGAPQILRLEADGKILRQQKKNAADNAGGSDGQNNLAANALKTDIVPASQYRDSCASACYGSSDGKGEYPPHQLAIDANQQAVVDDAQCMSDGLSEGFVGDDTLAAETAVEIKDVE
ncbi:MAG TPA: hypothetical protein DER02_08595 [Gammaproteobacteria bacterium]|nr:hypothetical protein [Gammaproteobacteria bacterium]